MIFPPHKMQRPPLLDLLLTSQSTVKRPLKFNLFSFNFRISVVVDFVSIRNTHLGFSLSRTFIKARNVLGLPSLRQFQLIIFIVIGGVTQQPPPLAWSYFFEYLLRVLSSTSVLDSPPCSIPFFFPLFQST